VGNVAVAVLTGRFPHGNGAVQVPRRQLRCPHSLGSSAAGIRYSSGLVGSVIKKRRKKMRKHKHKKMLKKTRWARRG
jgi:Mitochondrial domain of unknown function (DUF1713)